MNDGTSWPDAAIAIAGILLVIAVAVVAIIQIFATARARASAQREAAYRKLAEEATDAQRRMADGLEHATTDLTDIRQRTAEIERMIKQVG